MMEIRSNAPPESRSPPSRGRAERNSAPPPSLPEQRHHQPPRQHAGDAPAVVAGGERRLHRHDLVAHQLIEPLEHASVERAAADRKSTRLNSSHLGISYAV